MLDLEETAKNIIYEYWGLNLSIPIEVSGRLTKTLGAYEFKKEKDKITPLRILLSKDLITYGTKEFVLFVLKHEICHFILSHLHVPFDDGEMIFESELKRIGAFPTKSIKILYRYQCNKCLNIIASPRKSVKKIHTITETCSCKNNSYILNDIFYLQC